MSPPKAPKGPRRKRASSQDPAAKPTRSVGRHKAGPRAQRRSDGIYQAVGVPGVKPFSLKTRDKTEADKLVQEALEELCRPKPVMQLGLDVLIRDVIEKHGAEMRPHMRRPLLEYLGDLSLRQLSRDAWHYYWEVRDDEDMAAYSIVNELRALARAIRAYCASKGLPEPKVHMPPTTPAKDFCRVGDVKRMLEVAYNGWTWDRDAAAWELAPDGSRATKPKAWVDEVYPLRRMIALLVNSASRSNTVRRATWRDPKEKTPHFDLRVGNFVRRGRKERSSTKRRPEVRLLRAMRQAVASWKAEDEARGIVHVIHDKDGAPVSLVTCHRLFRIVCDAAGLENVRFKTLRASCAVWLMEAGLTPEQAAEFLGNTVKVLSAFYDRYLPEFSFAAADALDSRSYAADPIEPNLELIAAVETAANFVAKTARKGIER